MADTNADVNVAAEVRVSYHVRSGVLELEYYCRRREMIVVAMVTVMIRADVRFLSMQIFQGKHLMEVRIGAGGS